MTPFDQALEESQLYGGSLTSGSLTSGSLTSGSLTGGSLSSPESSNSSPLDADKSKSLKDYTIDAILAPFRGVVAAGGSAYDMVDYMAGDILPDQEFKKAVFGKLADSTTLPGQVIEGISEFATGFIPGLGVVGKAGKLAKLSKVGAIAKAGETLLTNPAVKGAAAGALSDFVAFDPHANRLSNLLQTVDSPLLNNAVTNYLAADENDSELEGRFKNAIEGLGIGATVELLWHGLKAFKARKVAIEAGKAPEEVEASVEKAAPQTELKKLLSQEGEQQPILPSESVAPAINAEVKPKIGEAVPVAQATPEVKPTESGGIYTPEQEAELKGIAQRTVDNYLRPESMAAKAERLSGLPTDEFDNILPDQIDNIKKIFNYTTYRQGNDRILLSFTEAAKEKLIQKSLTDKERYAIAGPLARAIGQDPAKFMDVLKIKADSFKDIDITLLTARMAFDSHMGLLKKAIDGVKNGGGDQALSDFISYGAVAADMGIKIRGILSTAGKTLRTGQKLQRFLQSVNLNASGLRKDLLGRSITDLSLPGARELVEARIAQLGGSKKLQAAADRLDMAFKSGNLGAVNSLLREGRWINAHNEFWINALLSGPKTALINAFGNTFTTLFLPFEGGFGAWRKGDTKIAKEMFSRYAYLLEGIQDAYKFAKLAWTTNEPRFIKETITDPGMETNAISASNFDDLIKDQEGTLANFVNGLGNFINLPTRFLMSTDEFFKQLNARATAKAQLMTEAIDVFGGKGLSSQELSQRVGEYVTDRLNILFDKTGTIFNKSKLYQDAFVQGSEAGLKGQALQDFMRESVDAQWQNFGSLGKISEYAESVAREATFQTELGPTGQMIQNIPVQFPLMRIALPFTRTPINILKFFAQRALPVDLPGLRGVHKRMMADLASGDPRRVAQASGRFWTGATLGFTAASLGIKGLITGGGPTNEQERKLLESTGWRPYSFRIGDKYVSYQRLDPFATFLGMAADLADATRRMDADEESKIVAGFAGLALSIQQNITNKTYLAGLERVLEATVNDPERFLPKFLKSQFGSYVPSIIAQSVPTFDPYGREARTFMDYIFKRVPGMSGYVDKKRNILGEAIELPLGRIPFGVDYLSPVVVSTDKKDKVLNELASLQYAFSMPRSNLGGGLDLREISNKKGQTAYDRWLELHSTVKVDGKTLRQSLTSLINSSSYKRLSNVSTDKYDSPRISAVRGVIRKYREQAFNQTLKEFKDLNQGYATVKQNKLALKRGKTVDDLMPLK